MPDKRDTTLNISEGSYLDQLKQRTKRNDSKAALDEARKLLIDPVERGDEEEDED